MTSAESVKPALTGSPGRLDSENQIRKTKSARGDQAWDAHPRRT